MIDTHYDLLTIAYMSYINGNYSYLEKISKFFNEKNVVGVIANLYFMSEEEMNRELPNYYKKDVSVLDMFKKSKQILDSFLTTTDVLYSIEGADYITGPSELERLYESGLDLLMLTWNNQNKYASGSKSNQGLTEAGKELLKKQISLGMGIDLSHSNEESFDGMIEVIGKEKLKGKDICVIASHSNSRNLCNSLRNLTDEQLEKIKSVDGLVGVFSNENFVVDEDFRDVLNNETKRRLYLDHLGYIADIIGYDNIMVATDDMDFCKDIDPEYGKLALYDYKDIRTTLEADLIKRYDFDIAQKILYNNAKEKVFNKIRNNRISKERGEK